MSKEVKSYPRVIAGAFIFNKNGQLLLMKAVNWRNKYCCHGGKIELGEKVETAIRREVKEETNLEVDSLEFIGVIDGIEVERKNSSDYKHLVFLDYKVVVKNDNDLQLNEEGSDYEWHTLDEWLNKDKKEFAPYVYEVIQKIKEKDKEGDWTEKYRRALADYHNLLRQTAREKEEFNQFAKEMFLQEILPVYDNLRISLQHINQETSNNSWLEGIKHIIKQFKNVLENMGLEEIYTEGEKFNHNTMEALEGRGDYVVEEVTPGYKLNGKIIRVARVIVGDNKK